MKCYMMVMMMTMKWNMKWMVNVVFVKMLKLNLKSIDCYCCLLLAIANWQIHKLATSLIICVVNHTVVDDGSIELLSLIHI